MTTITFSDVYGMNGEPHVGAVSLLYQLLAERPENANISHAKMPSLDEHHAFVRSRPYRLWYEIKYGAEQVGAIYATHHNEIGIAILLDQQRQGYATDAIREFVKTVEPLPVGRGAWLANVAPKNWRSKILFEKLGSRIVQLTYEIPRNP